MTSVDLDERKKKILLAIIKTYLDTGEPVGSRTISKIEDLNLSSATIRNEMADLVDMGYIIQPHTSAGRIPSDKGYRFYVDQLMAEKELQVEEREREADEMKGMLIEKADKMERLLKQVARSLSANTNYAAMISAPRYNMNRLKFIQLSRMEAERIVAVIVLEGNMIKNQIIEIDELIDDKTKFFINPTGRFVIGGPHGDAGLTGRKIIVDTYGGYARHGGGAFSGKDCTKVDRSAAYAARYVAKNIVAAGLADKCEIQLSYAIGVAQPTSIMIDTFGTGKLSDEKLVSIVRENFDLRPAGIIKMLNLRRPIYKQTAAYGHFGRNDLNLPWEALDKVDALKKYL